MRYQEKIGHVLLVFLIACLSIPVYAAKIDISSRSSIALVGQIGSGDAERMAKLMTNIHPLLVVTVDSNGGDLIEAIRLSQLIKSAHTSVDVIEGGKCASSCFFLFLAGESRGASGIESFLKNQNASYGIVGVHRPYLSSPDGKPQSNKMQTDIMKYVRRYLAEKGVSQQLVDVMMSKPSNEIYWLTVNDLRDIGQFDPAVEEYFISRCGYIRFQRMIDENWEKERINNVINCSAAALNEASVPLQRQFVRKLKDGWRPWN